jgi:hypothetical protein
MDDPPHDWMRSTGDAANALLAPLASPEALLGAAIFAAASVTLGLILRARHIAVALLAAVIWAAALDGALRVVGDGGLAGVPVIAVAAATIAVIMEFRLRGARPRARPAPAPAGLEAEPSHPMPGTRAAIGGSAAAPGS